MLCEQKGNGNDNNNNTINNNNHHHNKNNDCVYSSEPEHDIQVAPLKCWVYKHNIQVASLKTSNVSAWKIFQLKRGKSPF